MDNVPLRLAPGCDLRRALEEVLQREGREAAFVLAGIGSLRVAALRLAGSPGAKVFNGDLEIISLAGSLSPTGAHLHAAIAGYDELFVQRCRTPT